MWVVVADCQPKEVPPVPPSEEQASKAKACSMGSETSVVVVAVIEIWEILSFVGDLSNAMVLGVGGVMSAIDIEIWG